MLPVFVASMRNSTLSPTFTFGAPLTLTETHEVIAVTPGAATIRVTESGPSARGARTEVWATPGELLSGPLFDDETRRFMPPAKIYAFPMSPGQRWNQWVDNVNAATQKHTHHQVGDAPPQKENDENAEKDPPQ